jgi:tetratricopeptide (TPR) repeat protein
MGRADEAIAEATRAEEIDPVSLTVRANAGMVLFLCRRYDEAIEQCRTALELDPNFYLAHLYISWACDQKGAHDEAIAREALTQSAGGILPLGSLAYSLALSGNRSEAKRILAELGELSERTHVPAIYSAVIHAGLGETDDALRWLERAYDDRSNWITLLKVDPRLDNLHSDGRFQDLLRRIGFAVTTLLS